MSNLKNRIVQSKEEELKLFKHIVYDLGYTLHIIDPSDVTFPARVEIVDSDQVVAKLDTVQPDWYHEAIKTYAVRPLHPRCLLTTAAKDDYPKKLTVY